MTVIGLCGGSGSGKGTVARFFEGYGIPSIDADAVYRDITVPGGELIEKLALTFGAAILDENGGLNRAALAKIVFDPANKTELDKLNKMADNYHSNTLYCDIMQCLKYTLCIANFVTS